MLPEPYYHDERFSLAQGDCREVMAGMLECSIDAIVTDPPYELGFMGKRWDNAGVAYDLATWAAALRVLKPGGHLLAFGAPRTYHRLACAIEDAGFEVRDCLMWLFGSGFPKSLDVSKAIDKAAGAEREIVGSNPNYRALQVSASAYNLLRNPDLTAPSTDAARKWEGWGTALKPAYEPIILARKPLRGTVAANVQAYGTGALNIDGCRIGDADTRHVKAGGSNDFPHEDDSWSPVAVEVGSSHGRWPANVLLDAEAARLLDAMSGESLDGIAVNRNRGDERPMMVAGAPREVLHEDQGFGGRGGASRFFYTAKTSRTEREFGLDDLEPTRRSDGRKTEHHVPNLRTNERRNDHPTVKPVDLMAWLCRLVTPPDGLILDPFLGSGSTGMAALDEGFRFYGIDLDAHYLEIAKRRITRRHVIEVMPQRDEGQGVLL